MIEHFDLVALLLIGAGAAFYLVMALEPLMRREDDSDAQ